MVFAPAVDRSAFALLSQARRLGPPLAVVCGPAHPKRVAALGRFGAASVYAVSCSDFDRYPIAAGVEVLTAVARRRSPVALLIAASRIGQAVAGRLAVRLDALGISGSVRHRAGLRHAGTVAAVDRDLASPMFGVADLTEIRRGKGMATTSRRHP